MQKPDKFEFLEYAEPFRNCIMMHIHNPAVFTKIGKPCAILEIQKPAILTILKYSEPWYI